MKKYHKFYLTALLIAGIIIPGFYISNAAEKKNVPWKFPDESKIPKGEEGKLVVYGKNLVAETHKYLGPEVKNPKMRFAGNNLSCKNCHIGSGTNKFSGGFVGVTQRYPQFRARSNQTGTLEDRVNDCMERSMNGKPLPKNSKEMKAYLAYMKWLSKDIPAGARVEGQGFVKMALLDRAASPVKGKKVFEMKCSVCHGPAGQGLRNGAPGSAQGYIFPPLWGKDSFNTGAGMHRLLTSAPFIKANMPLGTPNLTDGEAYDVAAYINSMPRPVKAHLEKDFPNLKLKQPDAPYPPYADKFSPVQHKYGPFKPILKEKGK